ncbi:MULTISPECIES: carboxymuconolactone decarboxylase family protein [Ruegeria]|uniref:Carboxymuconolactone decarboxylase family protein n=1 Tax=Ruegeria arenilitoris TaxID=1173585 RepID=A0A238L0P2_9RHOB|nr:MULTISPECIES: peroxidase-related enzyme [Ruegeria]NOD37007.1 peroxidase-related enzyme [Ruegeria sp. HKCCD7296]NOD49956.1 peroxidase-related enzyme [Ruegeria sp. HKCCD5849]NOD54251.1 peroxidase-related enzyme [Ruegeria sp. HKCCD5851]NOD69613.1 peroxidase-related enzyme [Ruegeria sp. HKCCD7303]NOE35959.1 peroxidase-related enzyme [Ruegeria sp. HKCCD7318]
MKRLFPSLPENATLGSVYQAFPDKLSPLCAYESLVMRGESDLSVAERELIAAYVSGLNACAYCHGAHIVFAKAYGIEVETIEALMEDRDTAPVEDHLKPLLAYIEKLTVSPSRMTEADARAVYAAGWSESALFDAIQVCGVFNLVNRFIEGTGVQSPGTDPREADEATLNRCRSDSFYTDFGRENGLDIP